MVESLFHPIWHRHGPNMRGFSDQIDYAIRRNYTFSYPFPPADVVEFFRLYYGPTHLAFASLDPAGGESLRQELEALWSSQNRGGLGSTTVFAEHLEVIGVRS